MEVPKLSLDFVDRLTYPLPEDYSLRCAEHPERSGVIAGQINDLLRETVRDMAKGHFKTMDEVGEHIYSKMDALDKTYQEGLTDEPLVAIAAFFEEQIHPDSYWPIYMPGCFPDEPDNGPLARRNEPTP